MICSKCKGFTKETVYIGYYLCKVNTTDDTKYGVKPNATCCCNFKEKKQTLRTSEDNQEKKETV